MKKLLTFNFLIILFIFNTISLSATENISTSTNMTLTTTAAISENINTSTNSTLATIAVVSKNINGEEYSIASPISLNGRVLFKRAEATYWDEVFMGTKFYPLDVIKTTSTSYCELLLKEGHIIRIDPSSNLTLTDLDPNKQPLNKFKLSFGKVWAKVIKGTSSSESFMIETPHASISVKGTLFSILAPFGNISTFEGVVEVMRNNVQVLVEQGFETDINKASSGLPDAEPLSDQSMEDFKKFKKDSSLPEPELKKIEEDLKKQIQKRKEAKKKKEYAEKMSKKSIDPGTVSGAAPTDIGKSMMDGLGKFADGLVKALASGSSESSMLTNVKDKFINQDNILVRNPSLLAQIDNTDSGLYHFDFGATNGMLTYLQNSKKTGYNYGLGNMPTDYNSGPNNNVTDYMELAYNQISKGSILGIYLKQDQNAKFFPLNVYANKIQKATLVYGVSFPIFLNIQAGLLVKGSVFKSTEATTPYTSLNLIRNSGAADSTFDELLPSSNRYESEGSDYTANAGLSYPLTGWWTLGVGVDNAFYSNSISANTVEPVTHYTSIFHYEKMLLYFDYEPKGQVLILDSQISLANVPYLGKVLVGTRLEQNTTRETSDYFTSFKLWFFQVTAKQRLVKPLTIGAFNIDQHTSVGFKLDF